MSEREKIPEPEFTSRCGHSFPLSSLQKKEFEGYVSECPSCKTAIYKSKMIEGLLLKAREHEESNYDDLFNFFNQFERDLEYPFKFKGFRSRSLHLIDFDVSTIKIAINYGFDLNKHDTFNKMLLYHISETDNVHKLNCLIELGLDLKTKKDFAYFIFGWALVSESICILDRIKELGFAPKSLKRYYPFKFTYRITKWLIDNGFDLNHRVRGGSYPIHLACDIRNIEVVKLLLANGADLECKDLKGYSPVHRTISKLEPLFDSMFGLSPITMAEIEFYMQLFDLGADVESVDKENSTPLYTAIRKPHNILVRHLISKRKANFNTPKIKELAPTILMLLDFYQNYNLDEFRRVSKNVSDVNGTNRDGRACLHRLMDNFYDFYSVVHLIDLGADVNAQDFKGNTPLHYLSKNQLYNKDKLRYLLEKGADPTIKNNEGKVAFDEETIKNIAKYKF